MGIRTRSAVLESKGAPLAIKELKLDSPGAKEVLVRMESAGICRSDLNAINGHTRYDMPLVMGHEGVGIVEGVGPSVKDIKKGDRVILTWGAYCGTCFYCQKGLTHLCHTIAAPRGKGLLPDWTTRFHNGKGGVFHFAGVSSFSEYTVLYETGCVPVEKDIPIDVAAVVGCSVVTGVGAVFNTANFQAGSTAVVIGAGSVGLSVIQACRIRGASLVILVEPDASKWENAKALGATHVFSNSSGMPIEEIRSLTSGFGVDYAFDCVANEDTLKSSLSSIRRGGAVVVVGSPHPLLKVDFPPIEFHIEKRILGSLYGSSNPRRDIPVIIDLYRKGLLKIEGASEGTFRFEEINEALSVLDKKGGKYRLTFN